MDILRKNRRRKRRRARLASAFEVLEQRNLLAIDLSLPAEADARVSQGADADVNFDEWQLYTVNNGGYSSRSFLRFDVANLVGQVDNAKVILHPVSMGVSGSITNQAKLVDDDTWSESTITWNNKPAPSAVVGSWTAQDGVAVEIDVTTHVQNLLASPFDDQLSLEISSSYSNGGSYWVSYGHAEGTVALRPELRISGMFDNQHAPVAADDVYYGVPSQLLQIGENRGVLSNDVDADGQLLTAAMVSQPVDSSGNAAGTVTLDPTGSLSYDPAGFAGLATFTYRATDVMGATDTATVTLDVAPQYQMDMIASADAHVVFSDADANFGDQPNLYSLNYSSSTTNILVRFNMGQLSGNLSSATMVLHPTSMGATGTMHRAQLVNDDSWNENTVTWNSQPGAGSVIDDWTVCCNSKPRQCSKNGDNKDRVNSRKESSATDRQHSQSKICRRSFQVFFF